MKCLLCQQTFPTKLLFSELFLLKLSQIPICPHCQADFQSISLKHCPRCYKEGSTDICQDCRVWETKGSIVRHQAVFKYNAAMKNYFINYKFQGDYRLRFAFSNYFKKRQPDRHYVIVPIPLSDQRLQERGFNQVTGFLSAAEIKYLKLLRKSDNQRQSSLNREARLTSHNPFEVIAGLPLPQKVLLVDDIYTTGATLQHASQVLKQAGVKEISSFSLCR